MAKTALPYSRGTHFHVPPEEGDAPEWAASR